MLEESTIKLEEFNNCPGAKFFQGGEDLKAVDFPGGDYWKNDPATLVVEVKRDFNYALMLGQMAVESHADEFHFRNVEGRTILRLWWD